MSPFLLTDTDFALCFGIQTTLTSALSSCDLSSEWAAFREEVIEDGEFKVESDGLAFVIASGSAVSCTSSFAAVEDEDEGSLAGRDGSEGEGGNSLVSDSEGGEGPEQGRPLLF